MQDIKTRYEHAARFLPGQVERLVLNGEPVIRRSPAGVLYFAREYRLPGWRCGKGIRIPGPGRQHCPAL